MTADDRIRTFVEKWRRTVADSVHVARRDRPLTVDHVAMLLIAAAVAATPLDISGAAHVAIVVAIAAVAPLDWLIRRNTTPEWSNAIVVSVRLVVALACASVDAGLWTAVVPVVPIVVIGTFSVEPRWRSRSLLALGIGGLVITAGAHGIDRWYLPVAVVTLGTIAIDAWFGELDAQRAEYERRHDELVDRARMFVWEADRRTGLITAVTGNVADVLGYQPHELIGRDATSLIAPADDGSIDVEAVLADPILGVIHRDGHAVACRQVRLDDPEEHIVSGISIDVTELVAVTDELQYQAEHDHLTSLANRLLFEVRTNEALARLPDDRLLGLLTMDLDRFKDINDTLGHAVGDEVLRNISRVVAGVDDIELTARIGGDEFGFLVTAANDVDEIERIADAICRAASAPILVGGLTLSVSTSVGIAIANEHGGTYDLLLRRADIAMYQAKASGGGHRVFDSTPDELSLERLQLSSDIAASLDAGRFAVYFQPKVDLGSGRIVGAEALARWDHPELGMISPRRFRPVLEVSSEHERFTRLMLDRAIAMVGRCRVAGHDIDVAVNLGSVNFLDRSLPDTVTEMLERHDVEARSLTLEVTESELLDEGGKDLPVFDALRALGIRLSIDDFGTGYSSLRRLRALDADEVKIDRSFTSGLSDSAEDEIIVRTVIRLGRLLGHRIVAEGVETVDQLRRLRMFGCDQAQGFLFAVPMPDEAFVERLERAPGFDVDATGRTVVDADVQVIESLGGGVDLLVASRTDERVHDEVQDMFARFERREGAVGVVVKDIDGGIVDANRTFRRFVGDETFEHLIGRSDEDFLIDSDRLDDQRFVVGDRGLRRVVDPDAGPIVSFDDLPGEAFRTSLHRLVDGDGATVGTVLVTSRIEAARNDGAASA